MERAFLFLFWILALAISGFLFADPQSPKKIKHAQSNCIVEVSGGEYPLYIVKKQGNIIYSPKSDGIGKAVFSPNGEYIAFSGSEINWVDIGNKTFSIVVLKCSSGELMGFEKGYPGHYTKWVDNTTIKYNDTASENEVTVKIAPEANKSFRLIEYTQPGK